jgi:hypothetical protein
MDTETKKQREKGGEKGYSGVCELVSAVPGYPA